LTIYVALLRAVNVGGTGKLPMPALRSMCEACGFSNVRTYIASGNVVFENGADEATVKARLEEALGAYAGKPVGVMVRSGWEMAAVLAANPFASCAPNRTVAVFLDEPPPADLFKGVTGRGSEEIAPGRREIYVHYPDGMGSSKLRILSAARGTARNMNTVAKLAEWSAA
jgi:uncharacterized protein (DUF1697 family)